MQLSSLPTPAVLVDQGRLLANIDRVQRLADAAKMKLRPHAKTHKSPVIAHWQINRGAVGICCAKVGEAEVFAEAGIRSIRLPYPVHPSNAPRVLALMERASLSIIVDHRSVAEGWSEAMTRAGRKLDVLVKVDVGFHRCGIDPEARGAVDFIGTVAGMPGLRLRGLLSHAGQGYLVASEGELRATALEEAGILAALRDRATASGLEIEEISVGATPMLRFSAQLAASPRRNADPTADAGPVPAGDHPGGSSERKAPTELRPGNYVYFDRTQVALGAAALDECALTVLATVVSKPSRDRLVLDCGSKTLSSDQARGFTKPTGYGAVLTPDGSREDPALTIERLSEEHAVVRVTSGTSPLEPGDRVRVLPNHACVVSNLVDAVYLVDGDSVVDRLPVAARGRIT